MNRRDIFKYFSILPALPAIIKSEPIKPEAVFIPEEKKPITPMMTCSYLSVGTYYLHNLKVPKGY